MPRKRSPKRDEARRLWLESNKKKKLKDIAAEIGVSETQVRKWKNQDQWAKSNVTEQSKSNVTKRKGSAAPKGNKYAVGNSGGGAPKGNRNAEKYGFFKKHLPEDTMDIIEEMPKDPLDVLWGQIQIAYAAIIRAQKIAYVKDQQDKTTELISDSIGGQSWDVQQAWEKQQNFLQAQARAQGTLERMIARYDDMLRKNSELATEEQKARIAKLKAETARINGDGPDPTEDKISKLFEKIGGALDAIE